MHIILRSLELKDLDDYLKWNHPKQAFHKFNGPYFDQQTEEGLNKQVEVLRARLLNGEINVLNQNQIIAEANTNKILGEVSWYWKSKETNWLEIGVVIFNENYWSKGIGYQAMILWINEIFDLFPEIVRIGFTTWSGNLGMMKLGEKLKFNKEAVYRKARIVNGKYFDSVSYGILKEDWNKLR